MSIKQTTPHEGSKMSGFVRLVGVLLVVLILTSSVITGVISVSAVSTVTQNSIDWVERWLDLSKNDEHLSVNRGNTQSCTPVWIESGATITFNSSFPTGVYIAIDAYDPESQLGTKNDHDWVQVVRHKLYNQQPYTVRKSTYYVITVWGGTTQDYVSTYGNPVTFSYNTNSSKSPLYRDTVNWGGVHVMFTDTESTQVFSNGLNWACRREPNNPYLLSTMSNNVTEHDYGAYVYDGLDLSASKHSSSRQSIFSYNDELWYFTPAADDNSTIASVRKFKVYPNGWIKYIGSCYHNYGHLNSIGYDKESDTFVFGSGSSSYKTEGKGYIINNFSSSELATSYNDEVVLLENSGAYTKDFPISTYGTKCNISTYKLNKDGTLTLAMLTNDANTLHWLTVEKSNGVYTWDNVREEKVVLGNESETHTESYEHCAQSMQTINDGGIVFGYGHNVQGLGLIYEGKRYFVNTTGAIGINSYIQSVFQINNKLYAAADEWKNTGIESSFDILNLKNGIKISGGSGTSIVTLDYEQPTLRVTVPTVLPISVDSDNNVTVADNAQINNMCRGQVDITSAELNTSTWSLVDFDTDFKTVPVDTKQYGFKLYNDDASDGIDANIFSTINGGERLLLSYDGNVAIQSGAKTAEEIGNIVFTVAWHKG